MAARKKSVRHVAKHVSAKQPDSRRSYPHGPLSLEPALRAVAAFVNFAADKFAAGCRIRDLNATMKAALTDGFHALRVSPAQVLLHLTISNKCGQSFRWREGRLRADQAKAAASQDPCCDPHLAVPSVARAALISEWAFCLPDRVVLLRQDTEAEVILHKTLLPGLRAPTSVEIESTEHWLRDYLNLDVSLETLYQEWSERDAVFAELAGRFGGIRMLRQDPWECLIS